MWKATKGEVLRQKFRGAHGGNGESEMG